MYWDKLPPRHIEDCRYRSPAAAPDGAGAACQLLISAGLPNEACGTPYDVCSACLLQFPPSPDCWNTVIASLVYARTARVLESAALTPVQRARLAALRERARDHLAPAGDATSSVGKEPNIEPVTNSLWKLLPFPETRGRHRVRRWAVGVVTSPRRQPTLDATLDSIMRAGWKTPHLFLDGTVRVHERFAHLPGVLREPRVGCWPNYYLALSELTMRQPDADAYLVAEDDALFYNEEALRKYLEQALWPGEGPCVVSLYCPSDYSADRIGWQPLRRRWQLGAQAFVFPRLVLQDFLMDRTVCGRNWGHWPEPEHGLPAPDIVVGWWAKQQGIPIWYPTPSLVQHIGVTSTLGLNLQLVGMRRADRWVTSFISRQRR